MEGQIAEEEKQRRREILEELQDAVMDEFSQGLVGRTMKTLCCGYDEEQNVYIGRTYMDSPDVDGVLFFTADKPVEEGDFVQVEIQSAVGAELIGQAVLEEDDYDDGK